LSYKEEEYQVGNGETGPIANRFFVQLTGIQYGKEEDPFDWVESF